MTDIIDDPTVAQTASPTRPRRRWRWRASIVIALAGIGGVHVTNGRTAAPKGFAQATSAVTAAEMEDRYGVRIDLVALAALGGMVQLRFTVLDKDKAAGLFHDAAQSPALAVESNGKVLRAPEGMAHKLTLLDGGSYFMLYANAASALQQGTKVSVLIDKVRLEHLTVQR